MTTDIFDPGEHADAFIEEVADKFDFLCDYHGFNPPSTSIDRRTQTVTVTFEKGNIAIELIHDLREGDLEVCVARVEHGHSLQGYNVDRQGQRRRASLVEILTKRGVRDFRLAPDRRGETAQERFGRLLSRYVQLLQSHASDVLSGSAAAFDSPAVPRASRAQP